MAFDVISKMKVRAVEIQILLNQIAQGVRSVGDAEELLHDTHSADILWNSLSFMVCQAHPTREDVEVAISESGLKATYTPCVLLLKDQRQFQIQKIIQLPEDEWTKSLRLLIGVFRVRDARRREACGTDCHHGWHADFADSTVLAAIRDRGYV